VSVGFPHPEAKPTMGYADGRNRYEAGAELCGQESIASRPQVIARKSVVFQSGWSVVSINTLKSRRNPLDSWRRGDTTSCRLGIRRCLRPDHSSDFGAAQASERKASGPIPRRGDTALSNMPKSRTTYHQGRLHRGHIWLASSLPSLSSTEEMGRGYGWSQDARRPDRAFNGCWPF